MFDPAVIGTANIGVRNVAVDRTNTQRYRSNRPPRQPLRRAITKRIAASMRTIADWIDPVFPHRDTGGTTSEPRFDQTPASVSRQTS